MLQRLTPIVFFCALLLAMPVSAHAQLAGGLGPVSFGGFGDQPVEITADGETRFEAGVAVAEDNVQVHYGDVSIYTDYAEYNPDTRDVLLVGNVRIYTPEGAFVGQRAVYNLETKQVRALEFAGEYFPLRFRATSLMAPSLREFRVAGATLTTDDSSQPSWHLRARTMRIYPDDRVIFVNSTLFVKDVPVFWFPYLYSNLSTTGFTILPGFDSQWGAYLLTSYAFPIGEGNDVIGKVRADYRTKRGFALGFDADINFGPDDRNTGTFEAYHAWDQDPSQGPTGERSPLATPEENRYRVAYKQTLFLSDDIFAKADINVLSDRFFLEDFFPNLFRLDPEPDNYIGLTKWSDFYTINLLTRWQVNDFQQYTERLPELVWDVKNHRIFGWPVYYSGETGGVYLRRAFGEQFNGQTLFPNYETFRFDTFHQVSAPFQLFNWWSIVPNAGFRLTYYDRSGTFESTPGFPALDSPIAAQSSPLNTPTPLLRGGGSLLRPVFNFNVEQSFKLSKAYERIQARWLGLDGLRHVVQPYSNFSLVLNAGASPTDILQFDRVVPSTQLLPLTFPEFTAIDTIDSWAIMRLGTRQTLQTRRNNETFEWMTLDTFLDVNFENPYSDSDVSNLFNIWRFQPVPWMAFSLLSQLPLTSDGFIEVDARVSYMPVPELAFSVGMAYIGDNEFFQDSNQITYSTYWRVTDNWAVSIFGQYEAEENLLLYQRYMIHRDLSSWIASFGGQVRDNKDGETDYGILFVMTLKDAPQISLPFAFDAGTSPLGPGGSE